MMNKKMKNLTEQVSMGKWRFVFWQGVVTVGICIPIMNGIIELFSDGDPFWESFFRMLRVSPVIGFIMGLLMWRAVTSKYEALKWEQTSEILAASEIETPPG